MPLTKPHKGESKEDFIPRCMGDETMKKEFPENDQRLAVCNQQWADRAAHDQGIERRVYAWADIETREAGDEGGTTLVGHAAIFDRLSEEMWGMRERIQAGAFAETLGADDVRALFNHNPDMILGRNRAEPPTLRMHEDERGLAVEIDLPDTQLGRDIGVLVKRGDVSQMSFAFRTIDESWEKKGEQDIRTLERVKLFDVSPVTYPAYPDTDVAVRSHRAWLAEHRKVTGQPTHQVKNWLRRRCLRRL